MANANAIVTHHPKSPSKGGIWAYCSGAPAMWEHAPNLFSHSGNEGSAAHIILDQCKSANVKPELFLGGTFKYDGDIIEIDDEMVAALNQCLLIMANYRVTWWATEFKIHIPQIEDGYYGYADYIAYNEASGKLIIFDFKYGRVPVSPLENIQLMLYAIGAAHLENIGRIEQIELCIVQPRDYHQPIKREYISADLLEQWAVWLKDRYEATKHPNAIRTAGKHCKYCSGKLQCPQYLEALQGMPEPPFELSPERIEYLLDIASTVDRLGRELKELALNYQLQGRNIPNRKVVRKITRRKVASEEKLLQLLDSDPTVNADEYSTRTLVGIGALDKLAKEKNLQYVLENLTKPEGALELAPLSDSRPAVSTASEHFNKLTNK